MRTVLTAIYNLIATMNPVVRMVIGATTVFLAVNSYINSLWATLFARIDAIAAGTLGASDFSPLGFLNYVFPLDSVLTFIVSYASLRLACATVRIIKSFIPTIS